MAFDPSAQLARSPDVIASDVDGELVLISIQDGKYFGLDPVGSEVWRQLEEPRTLAVLVEALQAHFDGDAAAIERETTAFVEQLVAQSLIHVS